MSPQPLPDPVAPSGAEKLPVTVVIPAYNRPAALRRAIKSVLEQAPLLPAEIIVIDDASTDDTGAAAREFPVRVITHATNLGEGGARNTGLNEATYPWVALLDSDDEWLPDHLAKLWPLRGDAVLLSAGAIAEGADHSAFIGSHENKVIRIDSPADLFFPENPILASGVLMDCKVALQAGAFGPQKRGVDLDLWVRMVEHGAAIVSPEPGYVYHVHDGQVSSDQASMRAARLDLAKSFSHRPWCTRALLRDVDTVKRWDDARAALRERAFAATIRDMLPIALSPARLRALWALLAVRRGRRQRSGQYADLWAQRAASRRD